MALADPSKRPAATSTFLMAIFSAQLETDSRSRKCRRDFCEIKPDYWDIICSPGYRARRHYAERSITITAKTLKIRTCLISHVPRKLSTA